MTDFLACLRPRDLEELLNIDLAVGDDLVADLVDDLVVDLVDDLVADSAIDSGRVSNTWQQQTR